MGNNRNNPLNIKGNDPWLGRTGHDDRGHITFATEEYGIRANWRCLQKMLLNGHDTIDKLCAEWAPSNDTQGSIAGNPKNNPRDYANFIAKKVHFAPDWSLPALTPSVDLWLNIFSAMDEYENGADRKCDMSSIIRGYADWLQDFIEKKEKQK